MNLSQLNPYLVCLAVVLLVFTSPAAGSSPHSVIKVGVYNNHPIVNRTSPDSYHGLSIDVLESIARQEGWRLQYVHGSWKSVYTALELGDIDLLVGIAHTQARSKLFDFSRETLINNWGVVYRHPKVPVTSLEDLQGKRIALVNKSIHTTVFNDLMEQFGFDFNTVSVADYLDGLDTVDQGLADAVVLNRVTSILNAPKFNVIETGVIFNPVEVRYAVPRNKNGFILTAIDRHLAQQKQDPASVYHASLEKWLNLAKRKVLPQWVFYLIVMSLAFIVLLIINNIIIRKKVADRTRKLSESELRFRQLAENINEVFWIVSPDWREFHYVSPAYESIWGHDRNTLYDTPASWYEMIHPDDKQSVIDDIETRVAGKFADPLLPEFRIISSNGEIRWISARAYPIRDPNGTITRIAGIADDISKRKQDDEKINFMAHHDPLTGLTNRYAFENELTDIMGTRPEHGKRHALMYIDLDQFKIVNDTCGHGAGDKMLVKLANLLKYTVGEQGTIARLGGDEFGIVMSNATLSAAKLLGQNLIDSIKSFRFYWQDKKFTVGASIGMVMMETDSQLNKLDLLSAADMACYAAKERGRNRIHIYENDDTEMLRRRGEMQWVEKINHALEENQFSLYRQIIHSLKSNTSEYQCYEYLLRMLDQEGNVIMPNQFIPAAERFELMPYLDRWVVRHVFCHLRNESAQQNLDYSSPVAFINLSGQVFSDERFEDFVIKEAEKLNLNPRLVCFEITETATISNLDIAKRFISRLKEYGFRFALDDFGTGMSSFSYLLTLDVDYVKIDGLFIRNLLEDPMNSAIVDAVTKIGHTANLKIIAEWVENTEVLNSLEALGVDLVQGYIIDEPSPLPEIPVLEVISR